MDNNQPIPSVVQVPPPAPTPGRGKTMWLIGLLMLVIVFIAGGYLYQNSQQKAAKPSPTPQTVEVSLESELNTVKIDDLEAEFSAVDQDLKNL